MVEMLDILSVGDCNAEEPVEPSWLWEKYGVWVCVGTRVWELNVPNEDGAWGGMCEEEATSRSILTSRR